MDALSELPKVSTNTVSSTARLLSFFGKPWGLRRRLERERQQQGQIRLRHR